MINITTEISKIKSKIEIGMPLWVITNDTPRTIKKIKVTGFYLNEYYGYIILSSVGISDYYYYSDLRKTVFFTEASAKRHLERLEKNKALEQEIINKRRERYERNKQLCVEWINLHKEEYVNKKVKIKIGHDTYREDVIQDLKFGYSDNEKGIFFWGTLGNIYLLRKLGKTWYFVTKESKIADLKQELFNKKKKLDESYAKELEKYE